MFWVNKDECHIILFSIKCAFLCKIEQNCYCFTYCFIFPPFLLGSWSDQSGIKYDCIASLLSFLFIAFDLSTTLTQTITTSISKPLPLTSRMPYFYTVLLFLNLFCWSLLTFRMSCLHKISELILQTCLLSLVSMPSWWSYPASRLKVLLIYLAHVSSPDSSVHYLKSRVLVSFFLLILNTF